MMAAIQRGMTLPRQDNRGFTLVEILIVVAIIAVIAAIAIPMLTRARVSANEAAALSDLRAALSTGLGRSITCASPQPTFSETKSGYVHACNAGVSYSVVPAVPGKTGIRGFAGDQYGRVCVTDDGTLPTMPNCTTLK
jgi:prepilin-type N-terminal cleavage/methylation domain-containing protein